MDYLTIAPLSLLGFFVGLFVWSKIVTITLTLVSVGTKVKSLAPQAQIRIGVRIILAAITLWFAAFGVFAVHFWHGSALWTRCFFGAIGFAPMPASGWTWIVLRKAGGRRAGSTSRPSTPDVRPAPRTPVARQPSADDDSSDDW
jgi:hypothetical protein